jgi:hypothetical protein
MSRSSRRTATKKCPTLLQYWPGLCNHTVLPPPSNLSLQLAIQIPLNLEPQSCILCLWTILLPLQRDRFLLSMINQSPSQSRSRSCITISCHVARALHYRHYRSLNAWVYFSSDTTMGSIYVAKRRLHYAFRVRSTVWWHFT